MLMNMTKGIASRSSPSSSGSSRSTSSSIYCRSFLVIAVSFATPTSSGTPIARKVSDLNSSKLAL